LEAECGDTGAQSTGDGYGGLVGDGTNVLTFVSKSVKSCCTRRVGGSFGFDFAGTYTKIVPNKLIEYSFGDRAGVVEFVPGVKGVTVRVTFDAETTHPEEQQRQGWQAILNNFAKHVVAKDKAAK
jgi:hypothetical protein